MTDMQKKANLNGLQSATAKVGDISIHYWRGGDPEGRPILLWHGFLSTSYAWREVVPLLISDGYSIMVPDMRGFGDTDKPAGEDGYDGRALANEFRALVQQTKFANGKPLIIAAHDMGAPPALLWAADYPDEIEALLYIEAPVMLSEILTNRSRQCASAEEQTSTGTGNGVGDAPTMVSVPSSFKRSR